MKSYVVVARFDEKTNNKIARLQESLGRAGYSISKWPPHMTIAAYENINEKKLIEWTDDFTSLYKQMKVSFNSLNILPPIGEYNATAVLCLNPAHSKDLIDFYYYFHTKYEEYCTGIGVFNSISNNNPTIHTTICVVKIEDLQGAMKLILSNDIFGNATIIALEVYTYSMQLIKRFDLK